MERKCLRICTNSRRNQGNYFFIRNQELYHLSEIKRIDVFTTNFNLKFFEKCMEIDNHFIKSSIDFSYTHSNNRKYNPPYDIYLMRNNIFDANGDLVYYNQHRFNGNEIYDTAQ